MCKTWVFSVISTFPFSNQLIFKSQAKTQSETLYRQAKIAQSVFP